MEHLLAVGAAGGTAAAAAAAALAEGANLTASTTELLRLPGKPHSFRKTRFGPTYAPLQVPWAAVEVVALPVRVGKQAQAGWSLRHWPLAAKRKRRKRSLRRRRTRRARPKRAAMTLARGV